MTGNKKTMLRIVDLAKIDAGSTKKYRNYFIERTSQGWRTVREDDPSQHHSFHSAEAALIWIEMNRKHNGFTPYLSSDRLEEIYFDLASLKPGQHLAISGIVVWRLINGWAIEDVERSNISSTTVPGLMFHKLDDILRSAEFRNAHTTNQMRQS